MPIHDPYLTPNTEALPENIKVAFREKALISFPAVAKLLGIAIPTLEDQVRLHGLPYRHKGVGKVRPRRAMAIDDVAVLWHFMKLQMSHGRSRHGEARPTRQKHPAQAR